MMEPLHPRAPPDPERPAWSHRPALTGASQSSQKLLPRTVRTPARPELRSGSQSV